MVLSTGAVVGAWNTENKEMAMEKVAESYEKVAEGKVFVSLDNKEVVVVGNPPSDEHLAEERRHNCKAMGCLHDHVLYRARVTE